jgi:hypothetical protein
MEFQVYRKTDSCPYFLIFFIYIFSKQFIIVFIHFKCCVKKLLAAYELCADLCPICRGGIEGQQKSWICLAFRI